MTVPTIAPVSLDWEKANGERTSRKAIKAEIDFLSY